jgi:hypothetical protein
MLSECFTFNLRWFETTHVVVSKGLKTASITGDKTTYLVVSKGYCRKQQ